MKRRAWMLVAIAASAGCDRCGKHEEHAPGPAVVVEPAVPAPDGLLAEATIATPDATWQRVQRGIGGTAGILPSTLGGVVCAAAGIDPTLAPEVDGASPAYLVVAGDPASPGWAIAARLADPRRARVELVESETAKRDVKSVAGFDVLTRKGSHAIEGPVAALSRGGYLVVARSEADVAALAPYATRTMPTRPPKKEQIAIDVPGSALAGAVRDAIERRLAAIEKQLLAQDDAMRSQHGGRPPDFGDPRAIVAWIDARAQAKLAVLGDWKKVHVAIDAGDDDVRATLAAIPASAGGPAATALASLRPGDPAPLRALPRETAIALFSRDDAAARAKDAQDYGAAIDEALGARLGPADAKKLHAAIDDWAQGRGDWAVLAAPWGATSGRGVLVDAAANDPERASRAVRGVVDLLGHAPALRAPLGQWLGVKDVLTSTAPLANGAKASVATFARDARAKGDDAPTIALAWTSGAGEVKAALSDAPLALLGAPPPGATLGDDPATRALLAPLGEIAGAIVVQPSRAAECSGAPGAAVLAWSRRAVDVDGEAGKAEAMWAELEASDGALRCLAPKPF